MGCRFTWNFGTEMDKDLAFDEHGDKTKYFGGGVLKVQILVYI